MTPESRLEYPQNRPRFALLLSQSDLGLYDCIAATSTTYQRAILLDLRLLPPIRGVFDRFEASQSPEHRCIRLNIFNIVLVLLHHTRYNARFSPDDLSAGPKALLQLLQRG